MTKGTRITPNCPGPRIRVNRPRGQEGPPPNSCLSARKTRLGFAERSRKPRPGQTDCAFLKPHAKPSRLCRGLAFCYKTQPLPWQAARCPGPRHPDSSDRPRARGDPHPDSRCREDEAGRCGSVSEAAAWANLIARASNHTFLTQTFLASRPARFAGEGAAASVECPLRLDINVRYITSKLYWSVRFIMPWPLNVPP